MLNYLSSLLFNLFQRVVLCIDAIDLWQLHLAHKLAYTESGMLKVQLEKAYVFRELNKLTAGFSACSSDMPIATGKWGCGAFGGHPVLKVVKLAF